MQKKAFTLIELAIVLTIIGLLIGGSFKVMKMMRERAKTAEAKELVLGAKNAVIGDTLKNYDLGLPDTTYFKNNLSPSKDLNHPIFYAPASNLVGSDICAFTTTDLQIDTPDGNKSVAFAIAHEGVNYNLQTGFQNNKVKIISSSDKGDFNLTYMNNVNHEFDDVVEWVTLDQLQDEVGCVDRPFRFVTDKLPNAKVGVQYPSVSGTAKLEVENNLSAATITCTPPSLYDINFTDPLFSGIPTNAGTAEFECTATVDAADVNHQKKEITKQFVITIDPNYNKEINATCSSDAECGGGFCVEGYGCQTGAFDALCVDGGDCKSGICKDGLCSGYIDDNCTGHAECLSGYCDGTLCAPIPSVEGNGTIGSTCSKNKDCQHGLQCRDGVCIKE